MVRKYRPHKPAAHTLQPPSAPEFARPKHLTRCNRHARLTGNPFKKELGPTTDGNTLAQFSIVIAIIAAAVILILFRLMKAKSHTDGIDTVSMSFYVYALAAGFAIGEFSERAG